MSVVPLLSMASSVWTIPEDWRISCGASSAVEAPRMDAGYEGPTNRVLSDFVGWPTVVERWSEPTICRARDVGVRIPEFSSGIVTALAVSTHAKGSRLITRQYAYDFRTAGAILKKKGAAEKCLDRKLIILYMKEIVWSSRSSSPVRAWRRCWYSVRDVYTKISIVDVLSSAFTMGQSEHKLDCRWPYIVVFIRDHREDFIDRLRDEIATDSQAV
ncbi:hypothetical protein FB451DRAFT_1184221 [Mycena latifolia]|nr:hypothetical protein FB451DRAFT_1184221 [Mycena latifolia]